ncbi:Endolytic peptidoglycan transglycosylase RlpA [Neolewinella maritima]|uniref:Probable endolytic peptidoglycan transglycosylase RlpA n=2 Tax=Neolewinella maritima TaxID=1383882 RepID=A0ABM9AZL9_9BACT|nr:Endolytic peptidoglycan transglycosylase RlpA [Neolewinella maritima]
MFPTNTLQQGMKRYLFLTVFTALTGLLSAQLLGDKQSGLASYYSTEYDGAETAYGAVYDKTELVAAHKTYPYNSTVRVRNEENGRSVVVRIIDKGPFIRGRIVELSERAAQELGMLGERTVPVELTLLSTPDQRPASSSEPPPQVQIRPAPPRAVSSPPAIAAPAPPAYDPAPRADTPTPSPPPAREETSPPPPTPPKQTATPTAKPIRKPAATFGAGTYSISLDKPTAGGYGVQVGSFSTLESALDKVVELQGRYFDDVLLVKLSQGPTASYKVALGPFSDQDSAQHYARDLKQRYGISGFTITLDRRP